MPEYIVREDMLHELVMSYCEKHLLAYSPLCHGTEEIVRCGMPGSGGGRAD